MQFQAWYNLLPCLLLHSLPSFRLIFRIRLLSAPLRIFVWMSTIFVYTCLCLLSFSSLSRAPPFLRFFFVTSPPPCLIQTEAFPFSFHWPKIFPSFLFGLLSTCTPLPSLLAAFSPPLVLFERIFYDGMTVFLFCAKISRVQT